MSIKNRSISLSFLFVALVMFALICGTTVNAADQELLPVSGSWSVTSGPFLFPLLARNGLSGFSLDFSDTDHHIREIDVLLDCPAASYGCPPNSAWVNYKDNSKRNYTLDLDWQPLPEGTKFGTGTIEVGHKSAGHPQYVNLGVPTPGTVPVLTGFALHNIGDDMHLKEINIYFKVESDGNLYCIMYFADDTPTREKDKTYIVSYAEVPAAHIRQLPDICREHSGGEMFDELSNARRPVLTGIYMKFKNGDHHIKRMGVRLLPSLHQWRVTFQDKKHDDRYEYCIRAAEIIP